MTRDTPRAARAGSIVSHLNTRLENTAYEEAEDNAYEEQEEFAIEDEEVYNNEGSENESDDEKPSEEEEYEEGTMPAIELPESEDN